MLPVTLTTARFTLSVPTDADADAIYAACQDPDIQRWTTVPSPYEREHAEVFASGGREMWRTDTEYVWVIREAHRLRGVIGLHRGSADDGEADLGYWIAPAARGRGVLTEAGRAVLEWAFSTDGPGCPRIGWRAVVGNVPSARTARALGFRYEGLARSALTSPRGREDAWFAGLLPDDDRMPQPWPVLDEASASA